MIYKWQLILAILAGDINQKQMDINAYLLAQIKVLREQLDARLDGKRLLLTNDQRRHLAIKGKVLGLKLLREYGQIFTPETILRWHAQLIANKYDGSKKRKLGRPSLDEKIVKLILKMAKENRTWGYKRIQGGLKALGHEVSSSTISRVLKANGMEPAPDRSKGLKWVEFLQRHKDMICAADFFTVEIWTPIGLTRYHVLFVIDLATRVVEIAGIVHIPNGDWMSQVARNLTDDFDGFLKDKKYLIVDRDSLFTKAFERYLKPVKLIRLPPKSPNLNAFAERFVKSIKTECLNQMIIFGEENLRKIIRSYVEHYHDERPHQGVGNRILKPVALPGEGDIRCKERIGGLLKYYYRKAA